MVAASSSFAPRRSKLVSLEFRSHYFQDVDARKAFKRFLVAQHDLDLTTWEEAGFWDPNYVPFSFFLGDEVIASTCVYSLPMRVAGQDCRVAQLSSVATRSDYRRQGLNLELTAHARTWWQEQGHEFCFLFADEGAFPFYAACEFSPTPQSRFVIEAPIVSRRQSPSPMPLDPNDDSHRALLCDLVERRAPVSEVLSHQSFQLEMFHLLYDMSDQLLHLPHLDLVAVCQEKKGTLFLNDLIGPEIPILEDLLPALAQPSLNRIEVGFVPDLLEASYRAERCEDGDGTHCDESFPFVNTPFRFPSTAHA